MTKEFCLSFGPVLTGYNKENAINPQFHYCLPGGSSLTKDNENLVGSLYRFLHVTGSVCNTLSKLKALGKKKNLSDPSVLRGNGNK